MIETYLIITPCILGINSPMNILCPSHLEVEHTYLHTYIQIIMPARAYWHSHLTDTLEIPNTSHCKGTQEVKAIQLQVGGVWNLPQESTMGMSVRLVCICLAGYTLQKKKSTAVKTWHKFASRSVFDKLRGRILSTYVDICIQDFVRLITIVAWDCCIYTSGFDNIPRCKVHNRNAITLPIDSLLRLRHTMYMYMYLAHCGTFTVIVLKCKESL